eukprot:TRINITY_DN8_c0_g1_i1.p1 TRINITY_DN8_c0_g1~~TRINITY_DN8_c0_g1_i1.p1  ORF type:complete len:146 (-),score=48.22 TRINITY_DN8_c0_g1_i1:310-747(-)
MGLCSSSEPKNMMKLDNIDLLTEVEIGSVFDNYDANHDGTLDKKECMLVSKHLMKAQIQATKDAVKKIPDELKPMLGEPLKAMEKALEKMANDEKTLDAMAEAIIEEMDTNKDGVLQRSEFTKNFRQTIGQQVQTKSTGGDCAQA